MKTVVYSIWSSFVEPILLFVGTLFFGTSMFFLRRPLFTSLFVLVFIVTPNLICSYSYSPCLLRTNTESFTYMETKGIGALVNVSQHSFSRAAELITASGAVEDLRVITNGRIAKAHAKDLDNTLVEYRDALKDTSRILIHVESSVWTLTEM